MVFRQLQRVKGSITDGNDFEREHLQDHGHAAAIVDGRADHFSKEILYLTVIKEMQFHKNSCNRLFGKCDPPYLALLIRN